MNSWVGKGMCVDQYIVNKWKTELVDINNVVCIKQDKNTNQPLMGITNEKFKYN